MLSVLAFKRSLSAGILDGGNGEISLGGSRLNRFMKDVENVTGSVGEGKAVAPDEEVTNIVAGDDTQATEDVKADVDIDETATARIESSAVPPRDPGPDPWQALMQVGAQFIGALVAAHNPRAPTHPWIDCDPITGAQSLRMPLPPPETTRQLANALCALAETLRGKLA